MAQDAGDRDEHEKSPFLSRADLQLVIGIFLGSLIAAQAWDSAQSGGALQGTWGSAPNGTESMAGIATGLFDTWVVPFEVLSLLLLVALVGAVAMAMKRQGGA